MPAFSFTVYGIPQPQGSLKGFMRKGARFPTLTSDNAKLKPWRQQVTGTALVEMKQQSVGMILRPAPVEVIVTYFFERPKSVNKAAAKITKPDVDKLLRATLDALTGCAFEDDSQVTHVKMSKQFGIPARTEIVVSSLETEQRAA